MQAYIGCVDLNFFTPGKERNFYIRMDRTNSEIFKKTIRGGRASHNGDLKFYIGKFQKKPCSKETQGYNDNHDT